MGFAPLTKKKWHLIFRRRWIVVSQGQCQCWLLFIYKSSSLNVQDRLEPLSRERDTETRPDVYHSYFMSLKKTTKWKCSANSCSFAAGLDGFFISCSSSFIDTGLLMDGLLTWLIDWLMPYRHGGGVDRRNMKYHITGSFTYAKQRRSRQIRICTK